MSERDICINFREFRLHDRGVIHRDLKPANICYKKLPTGKIKITILDLGTAKDVSEEDEKFDDVTTRRYRSFESFVGKPYDKSVDLWGIGCMLFYLLSGGSELLILPEERDHRVVGETINFSDHKHRNQYLLLIAQLLGGLPEDAKYFEDAKMFDQFFKRDRFGMVRFKTKDESVTTDGNSLDEILSYLQTSEADGSECDVGEDKARKTLIELVRGLLQYSDKMFSAEDALALLASRGF